MKKIIVLGFLSLALFGCGAKEQTVTCTSTQDGDELHEVMKIQGDRILYRVITQNIDYTTALAENGYDETDLEIILELQKADYANLDGVKYTYTLDGAKSQEVLSIDYTKTNFEDLYEKDMIDTPEAKYVSYESTTEDYAASGITCVVE